MGDVNGKCKACKAMDGRPFLGNSEIWDPRKLAAVNKPNIKRSNLQSKITDEQAAIDLDLGNMILPRPKKKYRSVYEVFNIQSTGYSTGIRG